MTSDAWFARATKVAPGGVNSPVRAFRSVGANPVFVRSGAGSTVTTVDGDELTDFIASWGALILGHAEPAIIDAIVDAARSGTSFGVPTSPEVELAELITALLPAVDSVRMVNSGTEATASAIRLARAATGRNVVVKFEGCYHGHADPFLVKAGSGLATFGQPDSPGVPGQTVADTRVVRFNDLDSVVAACGAGDVAAVIVEPVAGNMGVVPPAPGFLEGLRRLCDEHGSLLIFDEVMTGFRVALGGAAARYDIAPDLTCLGKVVAGGTAAAAYGGRRDLMEMIAPAGPVYQAGTLAGNSLSTAAGLACLRTLVEQPDIYHELESIGAAMESALVAAVGDGGCVQRVGSMLTVFFGVHVVNSWDDADRLDRDRFGRFHRAALAKGVLLPPSPFEALFLMRAHADTADTATAALVAAIEESA